MKTEPQSVTPVDALLEQEFSLVAGGPIYQLLLRPGIAEDSIALLSRRILIISLFCWLPLCVLTLLEGSFSGKAVVVPFLFDFDSHVRFWVSAPLLIAAELIVHRRLGPIVKQFLSRGLVPDHSMPEFRAAIASAYRLRNSLAAEFVLIAIVYGFGVMVLWNQYLALDTSTWYASAGEAGSTLSMAGKWLTYVSLPCFQFLFLRWYFRIFIWMRFLWHVSRIRLNILPTHPDGIGGLGFLGVTVFAYAPLLMAHGAQYSGLIANRIFFSNASLPEFFLMTVALLVFQMAIVFGPLLVFTPQLERARRIGIFEYGALAANYGRAFDKKWVRGGAPADEPLLGSSDIQSLADMGNSFAVVKSMGIWAISKQDVLLMAMISVAPLLPLGLTMMPLEELIRNLLKLIF